MGMVSEEEERGTWTAKGDQQILDSIPTLKIDPAAVAFDIDSVFADTMSLFLDIAENQYQISGIRYEDLTTYNLAECIKADPAVLDSILGRILDGRYSAPLKPMDGAPEVIARLGTYHRPILFVTARPYPGPIDKWMKKTIPLEESAIEIITTGSYEGKVDVLLQRGMSYFVEDRLETCFSLHSVGVTPIVFKQPWNRKEHPFLEVGNWKELESLFYFG